jgi:beta-1,4-mannosyltransferase
VREPGRYALLVAGPPGREEETKAFEERLLTHPSAYAVLRKFDDAETQVFCRAADVAVFPYRRSLNSGALSLALTYGLPVVVRDDGGEGERVSASYGILYHGEDPGGLVTALAEAQRLVTPEARAAAAEAAERVAPARVSGLFAAAVRQWLDTERAP